MKKIILLCISVMVLLSTGCGYKESVTVQEQASYIYFTGNAKGTEVSIDGGTSFTLKKIGKEEQYKVAPGKHTIEVRKDGQTVVKRSLLLGDGIAREIRVP